MNADFNALSSKPLLEVRDLSIEFPLRREVLTVVNNVSFTVQRGEILGIVGESGAGKSVTGSAIVGLIDSPGRVAKGDVLFDGELIGHNAMCLRGKHIGMVFQDPQTSLNPLQRVGDQIVETIRIHLRASKSDAVKRMQLALEEVGLDPGRAKAYPHEFSGGMRQRVVIALALCAEPELIIADEPTTALDVSIQAQILDLLKRICRDRGASVILITHDMGVISETTDRVAVLYQGKLVEIGPTRQIIDRPEHPYTKALIACTPSIEGGSFERDLVQINRSELTGVDAEFNLRAVEEVSSASIEELSSDKAGIENNKGEWNGNVLSGIKTGIDADSLFFAKGLSRDFDLSDPLLTRLLSFRGKQILHAVSDVSFQIERGTTYALVGESGSGKSTIARMAVGLLPPTSGTVTIDNIDLNDRNIDAKQIQALRRRIQMVFQSPYASLNPRWRVSAILAEPLRAFGLAQGCETERIAELLEQVGLSAKDQKRYPHEFSGGQRQRISIARALASKPDFIICDEPTSALDVSVQAQVLNLLKQLQRDLGLTYLFITHDLAVVATMAHKIGVLQSGRLIEEGDTQALLNNPTTEYTRMLIESAPRL